VIHALAMAAGVDSVQFKALVRAALKLDLRIGQSTTEGSSTKRGGGRLLRLLLAYVLSGVWVAFFVAPAETIFGAALVHLTALALIIGATVILEFNSIVLSTDDLAILGHHPVSSTTLFFARFAHTLVYTEALGLGFSVIPLLTLCFYSELLGTASALVFLAAISCIVAGATLAAVTFYALLLRIVRAHQMRMILTTAQLLLSLLIYSALLVVRQRPSIEALEGAELARMSSLFLLPSSWFAAWVDVAVRGPTAEGLAAIALSLVTLVAAVLFASRVLAPSYVRHLGLLRSDRGNAGAPRGAGSFLFRRREARAVGLLVPSQFRHDFRFRLGVLGILPLTLLYLVVAFEEGPLPDPFVHPVPSQGTILLYLAVLVSPSLLVPSFVYSDAFAASWLYYVTPSDRRALINAMRNFLITGFMLPYLGFVAGVFYYSYGSLWHALAHAVLLGLCAGLFLFVAMWLNPGLPFAAPIQRGRFSLRTFVPFALAPFIALGILPFLIQLAALSPVKTVQWVVLLLLCNVLIGRILARKIAAQQEHPQYLA